MQGSAIASTPTLWLDPASLPVLAEATANKPGTLLVLFLALALSWAGVPALGTAAVGAAGVLADQGTLHLWAVLVIGTLGAEVGGMAGWWLGTRVTRLGAESEGRFADRRRAGLESGRRFAERWGKFMVFFVPSWVPGALGVPFSQFARWNLLAAALWTTGAGLSAYGVSSAVGGGSLLKSVLPIVLAIGALAAIAFFAVRHRRPGLSPTLGEKGRPRD